MRRATTSRLALLAAWTLATALFGLAARAQSDDGPAWSELSPAQRQTLQPLQGSWSSIDAPRREKWVEIASRFDRMSPAERSRVQQRMNDWVRLSPRQRSEARQNYQGVQQLSPQERQQRWEAYQALPDDQKRGLAARARNNPPRPGEPTAGSSAKINTVPNPLLEASKPRPLAPSVVQTRPGVSTRMLSPTPAPTPNPQTGLPKVAATPEFVDKATLLPQRGPQGAATEPRRGKNKNDKR